MERAARWDGIFFLLDGKQFAFRGRDWLHVPRAGDWVVFPSMEDEPFEVKRVIWRETTGTPALPYVEVVIERVPRS